MPDLSRLHELAGQVRTPDLGDLAQLADRRRRRAVAALGGAAAATLLVVAVATASVTGQRGAAPLPVGPGPSTSATGRPSSTPTFPVLTAQEIRHHPTAQLDDGYVIAATAAPKGVAARIWVACLDECTRATEPFYGEQQQALEVSRDSFATGALYALGPGGNVSHAVDDWFYLENSGHPAMVNSRGQQRTLEFGPEVDVTEVPGPPVASSQGLAFVDLGTRTVHAVRTEGTDQSWEWEGAADTWFWGIVYLVDNGSVIRHAALWRGPQGGFSVHYLPVPETAGSLMMLTTKRPGTLAVVEYDAEPRLLHVTKNYGETWQVRRVPAGEAATPGSLPPDWANWPPG
jgi:hypothetical protein